MKTIKCSLQKIPLYSFMITGDEENKRKLKEGRYHGSYFWSIKGFGRERWVVIANIVDVDIDSFLEQEMSEEEIVEKCVGHLNIQPKRKKYAKKEPKKPYGNLELYRYKTNINEDGEKYFSTLLITDIRKNKKFWSEGRRVGFRIRRKKKKT